MSRNRSTIIVPAGSTRDEGWAAFRNILAEINEASRLFIVPNQDEIGGNLGVSKVIRADQKRFFFDLGSNNRGHFLRISEVCLYRCFCCVLTFEEALFTKFFFSSMVTSLIGLKVHVAGSDRSSTILPLTGLNQFHEMVGHFVEIMKDQTEGMTSANIRIVDTPQR
ncbi:hypothetical protein Ancab_024791 [Ancistrocladus abbreviatus]